MPLPHELGLFNRRVTNRATLAVAWFLPPLAVIEHEGRRTGRGYRTPILAFPTDDGFVMALTYGRDVDWVKNVVHGGPGRLEYRARRYELDRPRLVDETEGSALMPPLFRRALRVLRVSDFLVTNTARSR